MMQLPQQTQTSALISTSDVLTVSVAAIQPVADVAKYLETRRPVMHFSLEEWLWLRVPEVLAKETRALLNAWALVNSIVADDKSVSCGCEAALKQYSTWNWNPKSFRRKYDAWRDKGDWLIALNRSKAGGEWTDRDCGLSSTFLDFVKQRISEFGRRDGARQAILSIHAQWRTGRNPKGELEWVPGYDEVWEKRVRTILPEGWSRHNIMRQLARRNKLTKAVRAAMHESVAAATQHLPQILATKSNMRFMEEITFDDLRFDFLVWNNETQQAEELWALIARDSATRMVLGFVLHPAGLREDGSRCHLGARHMKELAGQMLQLYPLPASYKVTWKLERGTAGIEAAVRAAMGELFGDRIVFSITSMLGGNSPVGYKEKAKGNSRGKGSHESHNRLFHTQASFVPGQTGSHYDIRPADLQARVDECKQIAEDGRALPDHLREQLRSPMLTLNQARDYIRKWSIDQNFRTAHEIEGFDEVLEWIDADGREHPQETIPTPFPKGARVNQRMERPIERAIKLIRQVPARDWKAASPKAIVTFLEHAQREVVVKPNGEITISVDKKDFTFRNGGVPLTPGTKALAYYTADDPRFLHLTDGRGAVVGTWIRRDRVAYRDQEALADAMRYTHAAQQAALDEAARLAKPKREELEALRAHNARVSQLVAVTAPPVAVEQISTPIGEALTAVSTAIKTDSKRQKKRDQELRQYTGDLAELAEPVAVTTELPDEFSAEGLL